MNDEIPWIEARTIDPENLRDTFALAARHALADVAAEYNGIIYLPDFALLLQEKTRIRYRASPSSWVGDVLYRVAKDCRRRAEPFLGALVVNTDGSMPDWWADTVEAVRGDVVTSPNSHAAEERLECYRRHGAEIPADGGEPHLPRAKPAPARVSRAASTRVPGTRATTSSSAPKAPRAPRAPKPPVPPAEVRLTQAVEKFCPSCFMVLPSTGVCDACD